jgi:hypothetical protein
LQRVSTPESTGAPPAEPQGPAALADVDDANDLRGAHFKALMSATLTWVLLGVFTIAAGVGAGIAVGPAIGAAAAVAMLLVGIAIAFAVADKRAAGDFFEIYAEQRGMTLLHDRGRLPPRTPLLRKGNERYTERTLLGPLAEGFEGTLALYTYEEHTTDSKGNRQTNYYRYTLGLLEVPECRGFLPELYCQRKFGLRALEKFEDVFRGSKERVKLESEVLDDKYEIFATETQDAIWLRRFFSPTFIVWMTEGAPAKFAFELVDGNLCCYVSGHKEKAADLDLIAAASAAVAKRLREESLQ